MKSDIEIARETTLLPIAQVAQQLQVQPDDLIPYGKHMAKLPLHLIEEQKVNQSHLILVTSITPTKAGIGKTTVSIGLALGLNRLGKQAVVALREPSLGPCFGMKGGAAGGGYAQVLPMENINLHFTGDFHAITAAHNTISALLDNYNYQNRGTDKVLRQVVWKRVLDVNDRSLRYIVSGLHGTSNGIPQESGFDITPASEIMAILCLATSIEDLRRRIENILLGYTQSGAPFTVKDLGVAGAITVLLKDALQPNLVQTIENTPAIIHGGPFANIAHGCNSILATKMAMSLAPYVVTEAGFGADLGAEKFFDIKCRKAGLQPKLTVLVATAQGLKMHGGVALEELKYENLNGVEKGLANLKKHIENIQSFGQNIVVAFNRFATDTDAELALVEDFCQQLGLGFAINHAFASGGEGAIALAQVVLDALEKPAKSLRYVYDLNEPLEDKIAHVAKKIYGAASVSYTSEAKNKFKKINGTPYQNLPICIAKTQYSFSTDAKAYGVSQGFDFKVSDIIVNAGAEFIVVVAGDIMRMPGLPKIPQANFIDLVDGQVEGLS